MSGWLLTSKRPFSGQNNVHHFELRDAQMLVWMESKRAGCANTHALLVSRAGVCTLYRVTRHVKHYPPSTTAYFSNVNVVCELDTLPEIFRKSYSSCDNEVVSILDILTVLTL